MIDEKTYRTKEWNINNGEDMYETRKAILEILKSQKASLSMVRCLFNSILKDIEDDNPITL